MQPSRTAVLSIDVEDWYHTEYLKGESCDRSYTMLDGVDVFTEILDEEQIRGTYFVLGEIASGLKARLRDLAAAGHEIGSHGWKHDRPVTLEQQAFSEELQKCRRGLEDVLGSPVGGFRAACFSLDRERLQAVMDAGFSYDSSRVRFAEHPLYGALKLDDFAEVSRNISRKGDFFEFEISTRRILGRNIPVSGGGYLRMLPWMLNRGLVDSYAKHNELYVLYIHPAELSRRARPPFPQGTSRARRLRFETGRTSTANKIRRLIGVLRARGFEFCTFRQLRERLL